MVSMAATPEPLSLYPSVFSMVSQCAAKMMTSSSGLPHLLPGYTPRMLEPLGRLGYMFL